MSRDVTREEAAALLSAADNILILTHARPDEDTLGSALALREALNGKNTRIVCDDVLSRRSKRVYGLEDITPAALDGFRPSFIVALDTATLPLAGDYGMSLAGRIDLKLDHHPDGDRYAEYNLIDGSSSACGEIVFEIIEIMGKMSEKCASYAYAAIASDTGGFKYSNVTAKTFRIAAKIIELGVDCALLNHLLFECISRSEITATMLCYQALHYYLDGRIAAVCFTNKMKEDNGLCEDDLGAMASIPRRIEGVELSIVIKQKPDEPRQFKISMRSGPEIECNKLCALFGGGGHVRASGAMVEADSGEDAEKLIVDAVLEALDAGI